MIWNGLQIINNVERHSLSQFEMSIIFINYDIKNETTEGRIFLFCIICEFKNKDAQYICTIAVISWQNFFLHQSILFSLFVQLYYIYNQLMLFIFY